MPARPDPSSPADGADASLAGRSVFTTGEAARVAGVSQQTIIRGFDAGRLRGYRVPGSRFRRIPRESLVAYLRENGLPMDALRERGTARVLAYGDDPEAMEALRLTLGGVPGLVWHDAELGYEAGLKSGTLRPDLLLLVLAAPTDEHARACGLLRAEPGLAETRVLAVAPAAEAERLLAAGADAVIGRPAPPEVVRLRVVALLGLAEHGGQA